MRAWMVGIGAALLLGGCQSASERATTDDSYCASLGAAPGSEAYVRCRMTLRQEQATKRRNAFNAAGDMLQGASDGMAKAQATTAATRPLNCTSTNMGAGTVNTTCY